MAIPDFQALMRPILQVTSDGQQWSNQEIVRSVAQALALTPEDLQERLNSGQPRIQNRIAWAIIYLRRAKALTRPSRGVSEITERGRLLLTENPARIDTGVLDQFEEFREFRSRKGTTKRISPYLEPEEVNTDPIEQIESALANIDNAVASELIERIKTQPFDFLERLVLRLMQAMNYGVLEESAEHLGGSGDEGFDGVIRLDALGLEKVYLQAKRYTDSTVGRPAIQGFVGALTGAGATRGVFITTSKFSADAKSYAKQVPLNVVLIDGEKLGQLLIQYRVGVQVKQEFAIVEVDEDFFEE
jgi:restriction system protein